MPGTKQLREEAGLYEILGVEQNERHYSPEFWSQQEKRYGDDFYPEILFLLTRIKFEAEQARQHWFNILGHRLYLRSKLGRDMGMQVALADYFVNINPQLEHPIIVDVNLLLQKEQSALRDGLTGLFNRRFFNSIIDKQQAMADRFGQQFSLLMIDVDDFKQYNDNLGHLAGDRALIQVAQILSETSRSVDYLVRYGGEEFAVILPGINKEQAVIAAERHRCAVEEFSFFRQETQPSGNLTISLGAATYPDDAKSVYDLVQSADVALYAAKFAGRNKVVAAKPDRRMHPRIPYVAAVDLLTQKGGSPLQGECRDVSLCGIRLATDKPLQEGEPMVLLVHSPELERALKLAGMTVRLEVQSASRYKYQVGIKFSEKAIKQSQNWPQLIEQLQENQFSPISRNPSPLSQSA